MSMTTTKYLLLSLFCCAHVISYAQLEDEVLMTVDSVPVYASQFKQVYLKNLDLVADESQKDITGYLALFKEYQLKIAEAKRLGYQQRPALQQELAGYKNQLADSYLTDAPITEVLVREAYDHLINEVRASHIMVQLPTDPTPEDTLKAWSTINSLRLQLLKGADFDKMAISHSEDPSVKSNGGDLGWFNAFRMVYPFEKAAYDTPVGDISPIVRTRYGYHILKTTARRSSQGEVEVAHIMIGLNAKDSLADPEARIQEIYKKLKQGESFEVLAQRYSEDSKTARDGGRVGRFGFGSLSSPIFEQHAFALDSAGAVSRPFKSEVGWHIIKLIHKYPVGDMESMRPFIESKLKNDSRSQLVDEALRAKLDKIYHTVADTALIGQYALRGPEGFDLKSPVLTIERDTLRLSDFEEYLRVKRIAFAKADLNKQDVQKVFSEYRAQALKNYYKDHLAQSNPEYKQIINEYEEGIMLFALMEEKIWNAAKQDSTGLKKYYEDHLSDYVQPLRYDVDIITTTDIADAEKLRTQLLAHKSAEEIKNNLNIHEGVHVFFTRTLTTKDDPLLPKGYNSKEEVSKIYNSGDEQTIVVLHTIIKPKQMDFTEAGGMVISDYQQYLEQQWLAHLEQIHTLSVDQNVFNSIKKELSR